VTLPIPPTLCHPAHEPIVRLLRDTLITPKVLAERWSYSVIHLANLRRPGLGLSSIKLPTGPKSGGVRYRLSEIVAAELHGTSGPIDRERVALAIVGCPDISDHQKAAVLKWVVAALDA